VLKFARIVTFTPYLHSYSLTAWNRVLLEKLTGSQPVKKFPAFHGTRRFITPSQVPATCSYPMSARSSSYPTNHFLKIHLNILFPFPPGLPRGLFPSGFPTKTLHTPLLSPIRATCPAHLILLDLITRKVLGEDCRSLSSSIYSFLHSHVTSSFLDPDILPNTLFSNTLSLRSSFNVSDQVSHP